MLLRCESLEPPIRSHVESDCRVGRVGGFPSGVFRRKPPTLSPPAGHLRLKKDRGVSSCEKEGDIKIGKNEMQCLFVPKRGGDHRPADRQSRLVPSKSGLPLRWPPIGCGEPLLKDGK
jgi:hypothetical protein